MLNLLKTTISPEILLFAPALISLIWVFTFLVIKKTYRQKFFLCILVCYSVLSLSYGLYMSDSYVYDMVSEIEMVTMPVGMWGHASMLLYIWLHISHKKLRMLHGLVYIPVILFATLHTTLFYLVGKETAEVLYQVYESTGLLSGQYDTRLNNLFITTNYHVSTAIGTIYFIVMFLMCTCLTRGEGYRFGDFCRFVFKGQRSTTSRLVSLCVMCIVVTAFCSSYVFFHFGSIVPRLICAIALAIELHFLCFAEYNSSIVVFNRSYLTQHHNISQIIKNKNENKNENEDEDIDCSVDDTDEEELLDNSGDLQVKTSRQTLNSQGLLAAFTNLMDKEQVYLDSDINIIDVANRLNVGRTTLSTLINHEYGKNFRAVINDYRIEFAKGYMHENPAMTQEQIAFKCGFKDASAFSRKFNELTGKSPLVWLLEQ